MRKINVLHLLPHLNIGGAEMLVYHLVKHANHELFRPVVASWLGGGVEDKIREQGVKTLRIPSHPRIARLISIKRILDEQKVDILHTHLFIGGFYGRLAALTGNCKGILRTHHGLTFKTKSFRRIFFEKLFKPRTDYIVAVSGAVKNHIMQTCHFEQRNIIVIPNGIEVERFVTHRKSMNEVPVIVSIGRLSKEKGCHILIKAIKILDNDGIKTKCVIAGNGPEMNALNQLVLSLNLNGCISFMGLVADVAPVLKSSDIFVLSSSQEGMSLSLLEAIAAGLPVVATGVGGTPEILLPETGWLIPPESPEALAKSISAIIKNPEKSLDKAKKGQFRVSEKYTIKNTVSSYEAVYENIMLKDQLRK